MNTKHRWPLWQPNQTANFPALAITRVSGLSTNPGAKAFAPHLLKTHECRANNALHKRRPTRASGGGPSGRNEFNALVIFFYRRSEERRVGKECMSRSL